MFHRKPTRIELKLEDMEEYEILRKEREIKDDSLPVIVDDTSPIDKEKMIHDRIGYNPQPKPSRIPRPVQ